MKITIGFAAAFLFVCQAAFAADFGVVMDLKGKAQANDKQLDLGKNLAVGDVISVPAGASVSLVAYKGCMEWRIPGPAFVKVTESGLSADKGKVEKGRKMPVCFKPADNRQAASHEQGALVLMTKKEKGDAPSPPEPDAELSAATSDTSAIDLMRKHFQEGKADVSELMTLVMNDLNSNDKEGARQYYMELKKKAPASQFVKDLGKQFN